MSDILVVLVNYNSPEDTYRCLSSLAKSTHPAHVVLVDNGSTGAGVISEEKAKSCHSDTHVIVNPCNDGFGGGNNIGIEWGLNNTQADYFFILNNDTVVPENTIHALYDYMEPRNAVGMCSPAIFRLNQPDIYWFGGGVIDWRKGGARSPNINRNRGEEREILHSNFITGCAMFTRRRVFEKIGGFNESFFMYSEDVDYCQRVLDAHFDIEYIPSIHIYHDAHASVIKDRANFISPYHWSNKGLAFVVRNVVYGSLLNLRLHAKGLDRFFGTIWISLRFLKWGISYARHNRPDGISAIFKGVYHSFGQKSPR